jgi:DNA transposition AAA+ family ATPase
MGDVVNLADGADKAGAGDLRERVRAMILGEEELTQASAAREIGISSATLNQYLSFKYPNPERIEAKIEKWLRMRLERATLMASVPETPRMIQTPTASKLIAACKYAQSFGKLIVIHGAAGVGKSEAAQLYRKLFPSVWIATITPSAGKLSPALAEIGMALNLGDELGIDPRKLSLRIRAKLKGSRGLLIIDEAQFLALPSFEEVRSLHDSTGVGIALIGGQTLLASLTGGTRSASMAQLFSRLAVRLPLSKPVQKDVDWRAAHDDPRDRAGRGVRVRPHDRNRRLARELVAARSRAMSVENLETARRRLRRKRKREQPEPGGETREEARERKKRELVELLQRARGADDEADDTPPERKRLRAELAAAFALAARPVDERDPASPANPQAFAAECLTRALRRYDRAHRSGPLRGLRLFLAHALMIVAELSEPLESID